MAVKDPLIARFAEACGATDPLDLRISLTDGRVLAEGTVLQPFTLVGRDDACDVTLTDSDVHPRHTWLQAIDGRVFAVDLGSRTGLHWSNGTTGSGWLDGGAPVRVGPFHLQLRTPVSASRGTLRPGTSPLHANPNLARSRPVVQLDFRNGKRLRDGWAINRVVTLVGRAEACKIHLNADDISSYHCGLVLTPLGLWVVDLSGRGVVVNGERMRVAPLSHGAELWVGRFLVGCRYPALGENPAGGRVGVGPGLGRSSASGRKSGSPPELASKGHDQAQTELTTILPMVAEDEVPIGGLPTPDPFSGLPSSHIMCDAFRPSAPSEPISAPIFVSGLTPPPEAPGLSPAYPGFNAAPTASAGHSARSGAPDQNKHAPSVVDPRVESGVAPLLRQLSEIHGQMFDQVQQSLLMMVQLCEQLNEDGMEAVQKRLSRIEELNGELARLQTDVARLALAQAINRTGRAPEERQSVSDLTPIPDGPPRRAASQASATTEAIQGWVQERIDNLQKERQIHWQALIGLFTDTGERSE